MKEVGLQSRDPSFINKILVQLRLAFGCLPECSDEYIEAIRCLKLFCRRHYDLTGDVDVLKECIQVSETDIRLLETGRVEGEGPGSKMYALAFPVLGFNLLALYDRFGRLEDLSRCIDMYKKAIERFEEAGDSAGTVRSNLASALYRRFQRFETRNDIDQAIENHEKALALTDEEDLYGSIHACLLCNVGSMYYARSKYNGSQEDLETGLVHLNQALTYSSPNDQRYIAILAGIGSAKMRRFESLGQLTDLHEAISMYRKVLHHTPLTTQGLFSFYNNLSLSLALLYQRAGNLFALEEAVEIAQNALHCTQTGHPTTASTLNTLATHLVSLSQHEDDSIHITEAIELYERSLKVLPEGHTFRAVVLDNVGSCYSSLFRKTSNIEDINKAIEAHWNVLQIIAPQGIDYTIVLSQIGRALRMRYRLTKQREDIDESINMVKQAIESLPYGHASIPGCVQSLAQSYEARLEVQSGVDDVQAREDRRRVIDLYAQVARNDVADPQTRLSAARSWAGHALLVGDTVQSMDALNTGVELISLAGGMEQTVEQRYSEISGHAPFVLNAVAVVIMRGGKLDKAIE